MQISLTAFYLLQLVGHVAIASPQHAVAPQDDRADAHVSAVGECSKLLFVGIDNGNDFVTANPDLAAIPILGFYLDVADGRVQMAGQVGNRLFVVNMIRGV